MVNVPKIALEVYPKETAIYDVVMKPTLVAVTLGLLGSSAFAREPKAPAGSKGSLKGTDFGIPKFGDLPKAEGMEKPKAEPDPGGPSMTAASTQYAVVKVQHAKAFVRSGGGASAVGGALDSIALVGYPPSTPKFTTVVRVKCARRANAPIEVVVLDPRGDTSMSASGELNFRGTKGDEADYAVDWDPTPLRGGGTYQVLIRIAGEALGPFPLKFVGETGK